MTTREFVLQTIRELPDNASVEEILDAVLPRMKVERGRQQIRDRQGLTHRVVKERLAKWPT